MGETELAGYDIVIIGGGPAGLTAALYAARRKATTVVFEAEAIGGQIAKSPLVENYPGVKEISGLELANRMKDQIERLGVEIKFERVVEISKEDGNFSVKTAAGSYKAKAVILATGAQPKKLDIQGEEAYVGRGVSYCAICDAPFFKDKIVAVVGGGNSAARAALLVADYAARVYLIHRRDALRAEPLLQDRLFANKKVEPVWNKVVEGIRGQTVVEDVVLRDVKTNEKVELAVGGVFVEIGGSPATFLAVKLGVKCNERGYIKVDNHQRTNVEGFFAAGVVTDLPLRQVATVVGEGATAATSACEYIGK